MIYEPTDLNQPINQGDIFRAVPRVDMSLDRLPVLSSSGEPAREVSWRDLVSGGEIDVAAILPITFVPGIVISQDCDNSRGRFVTLAQVSPYSDILGKSQPTSLKGWTSKISSNAKISPRYFYLPLAESVGFSERMVADFRLLLPVPRGDLEGMRELRTGRLNAVAAEHFRETIAYFFRRYAFNEWYPFTKEELAAYVQSHPDEPIKAYRWQE